MGERFGTVEDKGERFAVPIGDPRGIDPNTGKSRADIKLSKLDAEDRALDTLAEEDIEDYVDNLEKTLQEKPSDPDTMNKIARLRARLDKLSGSNTH